MENESSSLLGDTSHYAFLPINHPKLDHFYQLQKQLFWVVNEIDFSNDRADWDKLDDDTKNFLKFVLAFFSQFDGLISENLNANFQNELGHVKEIRAAYAMQNAMETIHNETYSVMIETFIRDAAEKKKMFDAINHYECIKKIAMWAQTNMSQNTPLIDRLISFACIEGILFSGAFAAIYWIRRRKILNGLTTSNNFIARDEASHVLLAVEIINTLTNNLKTHERPSIQTVTNIISSFVTLTQEFVEDALKVELVGINSADMMSYIYNTADGLLDMLGYPKVYKCENKLKWMISTILLNKTNFFEEKVSEYGKMTDNDFTFSTSELF